MPALVASILSLVARWLLSGILAKIAFTLLLNAVVFGAIFLFYKNFSASSLDYALSFFSFFGFNTVVQQIQYYFNQLPQVIRDMWSYFQFGAMLGFLINNYIGSIFLAWICRKFG
jgi:hypothetical protein